MSLSGSPPSSASSPQQSQQLNKVKLNRSKQGCLTCREKRVKCSETRPSCRQCIEHNRICKWQGGVRVPGKVAPLQPRPSSVSAPTESVTEKSHVTDHVFATPSSTHRRTHSGSHSHHGHGEGETATEKNDDTGLQPQLKSGWQSPLTSIHGVSLPMSLVTETLSSSSSNTLRATSIQMPPEMSLKQYCTSSNVSPVQMRLSDVRNTYLAKFTTGAYELSPTPTPPTNTPIPEWFADAVIPIMNELDTNSSLMLHHPTRLQEPTQNCIFQESYVSSLHEFLGTQMYLLKAWVTALFLLSMSIEMGMYTHAHHHIRLAIFCFKTADLKRHLTRGIHSSEEQTLFFLTEATFRYSANHAILRGELPPILREELPATASSFDSLMRQTYILRLQTYEILNLYTSAVNQAGRDHAKKLIEVTLWEIYDCEAILSKEIIPSKVDEARSPFGFKAYRARGWSFAAMSLVGVKLLLANLVPHFDRPALLEEYFAIFGEAILQADAHAATLDSLGVLVAASLLRWDSHRYWFLNTLRTGANRGFGFLITVNDAVTCITRVWELSDRKRQAESDPPDPIMQDWEPIKDLQAIFREIACR